jgi:hypothetical protein
VSKKNKVDRKGNEKQANQFYQDAARQQMAGTPLQAAGDRNALATLNYTGDYAGMPGVNWSAGQLGLYKQEAAKQNRGAYTFGKQYADPNLLAGLGAEEEGQAAQADQLGRERAVGEAKGNAQNYALQSGGLTAQRYGNVLGQSADYAANLGKINSQPGFWSNLLMAGLGTAGQLGQGTVKMSDINLKDNVKPLRYGLTEIKQLRPVTWSWKENHEEMAGLIAQEAREVIPEIVGPFDNKGTLGINYSALLPILINAIKELSDKIDRLEKDK